jgi:hypothetical protein
MAHTEVTGANRLGQRRPDLASSVIAEIERLANRIADRII